MTSQVTDFIDELQLVDHHVHSIYSTDGDETRFQNLLNEGSGRPLRQPAAAYDSQIGFAVRRWCAELIDLPPNAPAEDYWERRSELGEEEIGRRFTAAAGVSDWLIDTGFKPDDILPLPELSKLVTGGTHEIIRLEAVGQKLIGELADPADYAESFRAALAVHRRQLVGAKSVIAYRIGFNHDLSRPSDEAVTAAAQRWREHINASNGAPRLMDPILLSYGIHCAIDSRLPLQLHVGFGDNDIDLLHSNPLYLMDFLRSHEPTGVPILFLHCYPYEREAGYLAQAFETVYFDVGETTNFVGAQAPSLIARSLELAPFGKVLYSSDAFGSAELHYLGARLWRNAIGSVVGRWVADGEWSEKDAKRVASMIGRENALRVYDLDSG